ncbi:hypothetical protein GCM10027195_20690 [Comamonas sediminis]
MQELVGLLGGLLGLPLLEQLRDGIHLSRRMDRQRQQRGGAACPKCGGHSGQPRLQ